MFPVLKHGNLRNLRNLPLGFVLYSILRPTYISGHFCFLCGLTLFLNIFPQGFYFALAPWVIPITPMALVTTYVLTALKSNLVVSWADRRPPLQFPISNSTSNFTHLHLTHYLHLFQCFFSIQNVTEQCNYLLLTKLPCSTPLRKAASWRN